MFMSAMWQDHRNGLKYSRNDRAVEARRASSSITPASTSWTAEWGDVGHRRPSSRNLVLGLAASWSRTHVASQAHRRGPTTETKARYAFVYGDFRRVRRIGLIACHCRAAE